MADPYVIVVETQASTPLIIDVINSLTVYGQGGVTSVNGQTGNITITANSIGLGSVDNTPDLAKPISNLTQTALDGKAPLTHNHTIANITGLQTALDGKQATGNYVLGNDTRLSDARTPLAHTHAISEVTGLQTALDAKLSIATANTTYYPLTGNPSGFLSSSALTPYQTIANNTWANLSGAPNISLYAPLANASLTGTPTAPTAANGTNTNQLATTAFTANATAALLAQPGETPPSLSPATNSAGTFARAARADHQHADRVVGTAGTYGGAASVPVFTTDTTGRVTSVTPTAIQIDASGIISGTLANARLGIGLDTLTGTSVTWAANPLRPAYIQLTATTTFNAPTGLISGATYILIIKQGSASAYAVTWNSIFKTSGGTGISLSNTANAVDILTMVYDGTYLNVTGQKDFK